jgi:hypothetical protein
LDIVTLLVKGFPAGTVMADLSVRTRIRQPTGSHKFGNRAFSGLSATTIVCATNVELPAGLPPPLCEAQVNFSSMAAHDVQAWLSLHTQQ